MAVTKAVIAVAGYGTRWLPLTKAVEKCMVPILGRPIIDYVVEDLVKAGISDICFVVNEKYQNLKDYYSHNPKLEQYLIEVGKSEYIDMVRPPEGVKFTYVVQTMDKYGTTAPIAAAREFCGDEQFISINGDDLIFNADGGSDVKRLIEDVESQNASCGLLADEVSLERVSKYGVLIMDGDEFKGIVEKPKAEEAPSRLINVSRYLLNSGIWPYIDDQMSREPDGSEYYITDVVTEYAKNNRVIARAIKGVFLDGGNIDNWLETNNYIKEHIS